MALPILDFLTERMQEYDSTYEHRPGTAFSDLFMQPVSIIVQPLRDEANDIQINQSLKRILDLEFPDDYYEDVVDELVENYFVYRRQGSRASGTVRVYYRTPTTRNFNIGSLQFTSNAGATFTNTLPISVTAQFMATQIEDDFFYFETTIEADAEGDIYNALAGEILTVSDPDAAKTENKFDFTGGNNRETNTDLINRTRQSIGVRDLNTGKGFNAIMFENFLNKLSELQPIGFGDPEMMRDIVFNYHVGGRVDGFIKTPSILTGEFNVLGLNIDFTRRLSSSVNLQLIDTDWIDIGVQNLDNTENDIIVADAEIQNKAAVFYSYVDLENGVDLSVNQFIRIAIDDNDASNIRISGATPSSTQIGEIINRINVATEQSVASVAVNPIVKSRRSTGNIPNAGSYTLIDATPYAFANIAPGDILYVLLGSNTGTYVVDIVVSDNELQLVTPFTDAEVEVVYRISRIGTYIKLLSQTVSAMSQIVIGSPTTGSDALYDAIGLLAGTYTYLGDGPTVYLNGIDYEIDLLEGRIRRLIGSTIVPNASTGSIDKDILFTDATLDIFLNVEEGDILTLIDSVTDDYEKDYRILEKISNNVLRLDAFFPTTETNISYRVTRTGIKNNNITLLTFDYNPMSIDVGNQVILDDYGRVRGIRTGREDYTITDMAFLYITQIELIDPVSLEPLEVILDGKGGYGRGGYGQGGFGVGSQSEYNLHVNLPTARFSAYEDSFIAINTSYLGQSFKVTYKYVPEVVEFQTFASSDSERVLDADTLIRHFIPAVVDLTIEYTTDPTNVSTPTQDEVRAAIEDFINNVPAGRQIDASDINDVIYEQIDPNRTRKARVKAPIYMYATIHNTDNSLTILESTDTLQIPEDDIPQFTTAPLSPRTAHWIAGTINITATELTSSGVI